MLNNRNFKKDFGRFQDRMPAFQLNKFQSEYNLSLNREMVKILADALQRNEDVVQNNGKSVPTCLFALLSKLEDALKPKVYDDRNQDGHYDDRYDHNDAQNEEKSYQYDD